MEAPSQLPRSGRRLARHLARRLCLGALILVPLGTAAAPAGAAAATGVRIDGPGGAQGFVSEAELKAAAEAEPTREYLLRATPGEAGTSTPRRGVPVRALIESAGIAFDPEGFVTVPRPNGTVAYLPTADFEEPSPVFEEGKPAVFSADSGSIRFLRPLIAADPEDVNAEDNIATVGGESLDVGVRGGHVLEVTATATSTSLESGAAVTLTAAVTGGLPGEAISFSWSFGDGSFAAGTTVSHSFAGVGTYEVRVTATGNEESGGESRPLDLVVGNPPVTETPGATTTAEPKKARKPDGAEGKEARQSGARGGSGSPGAGAGGNGSGGGEGSGGEGGGTDRSAEEAEVTRPQGLAAPSVEAAPPGPSPRPEDRPPGVAAEVAKAPADPSTAAPAGELVEGRLVGDDLGPVDLDEALAGSAAGQGSPSAAGSAGGSGRTVPVAALIVVALFAGGALYEWRRGRAIS
jgi:hypothetical protein